MKKCTRSSAAPNIRIYVSTAAYAVFFPLFVVFLFFLPLSGPHLHQVRASILRSSTANTRARRYTKLICILFTIALCTYYFG